MRTCRDIIEAMERIAPPALALEDDNIGFLIGDKDAKVKRVLVTLDINEDVIEEALGMRADMIVSHHPLIYRPFSSIVEQENGSLISHIIRNGINVYAAHTNWDCVKGGVNDCLAGLVGLRDTSPLVPDKNVYYKFCVFAPKEYAASVRQAICDAGAGTIGNYSACTFTSAGEGTFTPMDGSSAFVGEIGEFNRVREEKIEALVPKYLLGEVIARVIEKHPYECPAYDVIKQELNADCGMGRIGDIRPQSFGAFCELVREQLNRDDIRIMGGEDAIIERVAVVGGSGDNYIKAAADGGAQVLLSGDIRHHAQFDAQQAGIFLIDGGHYHTEMPSMYALAKQLNLLLQPDFDVEVVVTKVETYYWE